MKPKILIQFAVALILAGSAGYFTYNWLAAQAHLASDDGPKTVSVVVASKDLPRGAVLTKDMLKVVPYMPESLPPDCFSEIDQVVDRMVVGTLVMNEPVLESRLVSEGVGINGVSPLISKGKRAMGVRGDRVLGLSGFVRPGNRVDVLVTLDEAPNGEPATKLVLEDIPVLASGTEIEHTGETDEPSPVDVYSLELTPKESEILALASTQGTLHFALRNDQDEKKILTRGMQIAEMLKQNGGMRFGKKKKAVRTKNRGVEVIKGISRKIARF
jgi:pilus assembly protein CpaB